MMLAEIGDKMWTVPEVLVLGVILALASSLPGFIRLWLLLPSMALAIYGNHSCWLEMHGAPGMWDAVRNEMGWTWIIGNFLAWNLAFTNCWAVVYCFHQRGTRLERRQSNLCECCAYNLTGNVSGICPECGQQV